MRSDLQRIRQRAARLVADIDEMIARMEEHSQPPQLVAVGGWPA